MKTLVKRSWAGWRSEIPSGLTFSSATNLDLHDGYEELFWPIVLIMIPRMFMAFRTGRWERLDEAARDTPQVGGILVF